VETTERGFATVGTANTCLKIEDTGVVGDDEAVEEEGTIVSPGGKDMVNSARYATSTNGLIG
jgi:hypothetical protein